MIREKTGLVPDAYFCATKIQWILRNVPGARVAAQAGELLFGTVDAWLIWNLTREHVHVTDVSNASRTMLFNIHTLAWDDELLERMEIPRAILPEVVDSSGVIGTLDKEILGAEIPRRRSLARRASTGAWSRRRTARAGSCSCRPARRPSPRRTAC